MRRTIAGRAERFCSVLAAVPAVSQSPLTLCTTSPATAVSVPVVASALFAALAAYAINEQKLRHRPLDKHHPQDVEG